MYFRRWGRQYIEILLGRRNRTGCIIRILFSILFGLMWMLSGQVCFSGIFGTLSENYIRPLTITSWLVFIAAFFISYMVICLVETECIYGEKRILSRRKDIKRRWFWIFSGILILCWLPYYLSNFPGGIFSDTFSSISQARGLEPLNNHNPILYTLLIQGAIKLGTFLGRGIQFSMGLFTLFQLIAMAFSLGYFLYWMYKKGINWAYIILTALFFTLFHLIPYYAIAVWKDTPFNLALFLYILCILDISMTHGELLYTWKGIIRYTILALLVAFLRSNIFILIILITCILLIIYRKQFWKQMRRFTIVSIAMMLGIYGIQGPLYTALGYNDIQTVETYGCLLQHIAYVISTDGEVTEEQLEFLDQLMPIEKIKEAYVPCIVDPLKWHEDFNEEYLDMHKGEFLRIWVDIAVKNPKKVLEAHLLETLGFWDVREATFDGYIINYIWSDVDYLQEIDYFQKLLGFSFDEIVSPQKPTSPAVFVWMALASLAIVASQRKKRFILVYVPVIFVWLGIMISAPLAFSLRYIYIFVLLVPLFILLPMLPHVNEVGREIGQERMEII